MYNFQDTSDRMTNNTNTSHLYWNHLKMVLAWFPHNVENYELIFLVWEMSLNFIKSGNAVEIFFVSETIHLEQKTL